MKVPLRSISTIVLKVLKSHLPHGNSLDNTNLSFNPGRQILDSILAGNIANIVISVNSQLLIGSYTFSIN
jgi:hypothetical protein